ncbi:lipase family alpha/beta hydrolase [Planctobacterium marinum]|uniref:AB hydrolase-1 domain-containing protein n=1 Tax=Planctobacterium marinum TaxID=1631968 RepID=A0AA48KPB7_9ALTE|nr:hypothetical protein MACH26_20020 [Planctobacterium marinum]
MEDALSDISVATQQHYNDSLYELLSSAPMDLLNQHPNINLNIDVDRLGQIFTEFNFTRQMQAKEPWLQPQTFQGAGITASAFRANSYNIDDQEYPLEGVYRPFTFYVEEVVDQNKTLKIHIHGKHMSHNKRLLDSGVKLAYSPGAPFLTLLNKANIDDSSITGLLKAESAEHRFGIFALQEFSADRIPIFMIHGLNSSPLIWRKMTMAIINDEQLNSRYQVWHAFYPSGPPPFYNAMRLRKKMTMMMGRFAENDIARQQMHVIGHSMGGIIAKTFAIDTQDVLWNTVFSKPPEYMQEALTKNPEMQDIFIFEPPVPVNQLFFLDTPHRGSELASSWIGRLGAGLINLPKRFTNMFADLIEQFGVEVITPPMRPFLATHGPNSIEVLRPNHPMMTALNEFQLPENTFSIVGSDGDLTCPDGDCNQISDGVVAWTSATKKDLVKEEIIVASQHDSFNNDEAIAFILRQLRSQIDKAHLL